MSVKSVITVRPDYSRIRNEMHFEVQLRTRSHVFKNKKAYDRHKNKKIIEDSR